MGIQRRHFLQQTGGLALAALMQARPVEAAEEGFCSPNDPLEALMDGEPPICRGLAPGQAKQRNDAPNGGSRPALLQLPQGVGHQPTSLGHRAHLL